MTRKIRDDNFLTSCPFRDCNPPGSDRIATSRQAAERDSRLVILTLRHPKIHTHEVIDTSQLSHVCRPSSRMQRRLGFSLFTFFYPHFFFLSLQRRS